jgi:hypothetical protein
LLRYSSKFNSLCFPHHSSLPFPGNTLQSNNGAAATQASIMALLLRTSLLLAITYTIAGSGKDTTGTESSFTDVVKIGTDVVDDLFIAVPCEAQYTSEDPAHHSSPCGTNSCGRRVVDNLFSEEDIASLLRIVEKGMSHRESLGGPTILDINTGYIRDSAGLDNLFFSGEEVYSVIIGVVSVYMQYNCVYYCDTF